jgi:hypothetical protein
MALKDLAGTIYKNVEPTAKLICKKENKSNKTGLAPIYILVEYYGGNNKKYW